MNKKGDFNFVTIFAIVAGIAFLILAISGASKVTETKKYETNTKITQTFSNYLNSLEAGFATSNLGEVDFKQQVDIINYCNYHDDFGDNEFSLRIVKNKQENYGASITTSNKYVFSNENLKGEKVFSLSRGFNYPYKISDFIILIPDSDKYCFEFAPQVVRKSLNALSQNNSLNNFLFENCFDNEDYIQVCEDDSSCDISIVGKCESCESEYEYGYVEKDGEDYWYISDLVYPAIFSDYDNYECNVNRLIYRQKTVTELYLEKIKLLNKKNCPTMDETQVENWKKVVDGIVNVKDLIANYEAMKDIDKINSGLRCNLW